MKDRTAALPRHQVEWYGWRPDLPDFRDHKYTVPRVKLPQSVDLRTSGHLPPVYDQGDLGSCTGNGISALMSYVVHRDSGQKLIPSRLFIYYNERVIENTVGQDAGAMIRDGIKAVHKLGAPDESLWPYDISQFKKRPTAAAYDAATLDLATAYERVDRTAVRKALAAGQPVVFGFTVYESFESQEVARTGLMPLPSTSEKMLGGHCILAVGYDDTKQCPGGAKPGAYLIRNSWGTDWAQQGYFWMPYEIIAQRALSSDFWTIKAVGK